MGSGKPGRPAAQITRELLPTQAHQKCLKQAPLFLLPANRLESPGPAAWTFFFMAKNGIESVETGHICRNLEPRMVPCSMAVFSAHFWLRVYILLFTEHPEQPQAAARSPGHAAQIQDNEGTRRDTLQPGSSSISPGRAAQILHERTGTRPQRVPKNYFFFSKSDHQPSFFLQKRPNQVSIFSV